MNSLCLDLGTSCGYCYNEGSTMLCGTWSLATTKEIKEFGKLRLNRRGDPRIKRLAALLSPFCGKVDAILYEDVLFSSTTYACQLWASLRAAIWLSCDDKIIRECVPVQTLKIFAAGKGNADKDAMCLAVVKWNPERFSIQHGKLWDSYQGLVLTDDAADAIHLWRWSQQHVRIK